MKKLFKKKNLYLFTFAIFIFFLLITRLYINHLLKIPLHFDEAQYWSWSKQMAWGYFSKPPFLAWCINFISNICGNGEGCIRSLSPFFHIATTLGIFYSSFKITNKISNSIFASIIFLLMPGITFSSLFISTDVPLIFFSTLVGTIIIKLYIEDRKQSFYIYAILALALALATLSKYAAVYLVPSIMLACVISSRLRRVLYKKELAYTILLYLLFIIPNIIWNFNNGFVTFNHTFDNANINTISLSLYKPIQFIMIQFLVFGSFSFLYIIIILIKYKDLVDYQRILLTIFLFPILLISLLAIFSRVNANWAVVGYPFGCILLSTFGQKIVTTISKNLIIGGQLLASIIFIIFLFFSYSTNYNPFIKIMHARELSLEIKNLISTRKNIGFMADDREDYAHFLYYNRDLNLKKAKWNGDKKINDHYELTTSVDDLISLDIIFLTRTKPTQAMIKRTEKYLKLKSIHYKVNNKIRLYNVYLFKNWN